MLAIIPHERSLLMDINDKVARYRLLACLALADENVEIEELDFLERAMERFGLDTLDEHEKARVTVLLSEDEALAAVHSLSDTERHAFLADCVDLAWADNHLDEDEVAMITRVATAMGLLAAIPAVILYNHFLGRLRSMEARIDEFVADLIHRIQGRRS